MPSTPPIPFAYHLLVCRYDEVTHDEITPTARAIYEHVVAQGDNPKEWRHEGITAVWPDGVKVTISLLDPLFRIENVPDIPALRAEAQARIKQDAARQAQWLSTLTGSVTGSPWLCDMGEDYVLRLLIEERQFSWRPVETVDWDMVDARFARARHEFKAIQS